MRLRIEPLDCGFLLRAERLAFRSNNGRVCWQVGLVPFASSYTSKPPFMAGSAGWPLSGPTDWEVVRRSGGGGVAVRCAACRSSGSESSRGWRIVAVCPGWLTQLTKVRSVCCILDRSWHSMAPVWMDVSGLKPPINAV